MNLSLDESGHVVEPESKTREYKRDLGSPDELLKTVVAFANSAGGQLVIGVTDDLTVVGVEDPFAEELRLTNLIADRIAPQLLPSVEMMTLADKTVLIVDVSVGSQRPYYLKRLGSTQLGPHQGTYLRLGSSDRQATSAAVEELRREGQRVRFEELPSLHATMSDLDIEALSAMLSRPVTESTLQTLGLVTEDQGKLHPTNAGIVVACPTPHHFLPSAYVRCARFRGRERIDIFDRVEVESFLPKAVDTVEAFLQKHAFLTAEFPSDSWRRHDVWSIPMRAIRELVINAIVHASYAEQGAPIRVSFFDDRIEVENPGDLLPSVTVESMKAGISKLRNPTIARVFRDMSLMEQWGTGFPHVIAELAERGLPGPEVQELSGIVRIIVHIPDHMPRIMPTPGTDRAAHVDDLYGKALSQPQKALSPTLSQPQEALSPTSGSNAFKESSVSVLRRLRDGSASRSELLSYLGLKNDSRAYQRHLAPLLEAGLISRTIPDKPNAHTQRYMITEAGKAYLLTV